MCQGLYKGTYDNLSVMTNPCSPHLRSDTCGNIFIIKQCIKKYLTETVVYFRFNNTLFNSFQVIFYVLMS